MEGFSGASETIHWKFEGVGFFLPLRGHALET